jgi:hypothetical protein
MDNPEPGFDHELDHEAVDPEGDPEPLEDIGEPLEWVPLEEGGG